MLSDPCIYNTTQLLTSPAVETPGTTNVATGSKLRRQKSRQTLCEDIRKPGCRRYVQDMDITDGHAFPHKVEDDLDMLYALAGAVEGTVWGVAHGAAEVGEAGDEGATQVLVIRPPRVVV
jgi:hypothetical protein